MQVINAITFMSLLNALKNDFSNLNIWEIIARNVAAISIIAIIGWLMYDKIKREYEIKLYSMENMNERLKERLSSNEQELEKLKKKMEIKNAELSKLKEDINKKDGMIKDFQNKINQVEKLKEFIRKLKEEKEHLEAELTRKENEIERLKEGISLIDEEYYGDLDYWSGKRLYELRQRFPKISYRKMEEFTGISKSTIQKRVEKYMDSLRI